MYGYIYETTNLINGKKYIGQHHASEFEWWYKGSGKLIKKAFDKYGFDNFEVKLLENCNSKEELDEKEIYWINYYDAVNSNNYYNLAEGGSNGALKLMQEAARQPEIRAKAAPKIMETRRKKYNGDASPWFHTDEANRKKVETRKERYGDAGFALRTDDAKLNAKKARIEKFGSSNGHMMTKEVRDKARRKTSDILEFDNKIFIGYNELSEYINSTYNEYVTIVGLRRIVHGFNTVKYKKYFGKIKIIQQGSRSKASGKVYTETDDLKKYDSIEPAKD